MSEQEEQIGRVRDRIAPAVVSFWKDMVNDTREFDTNEFYADDLREYVTDTTGIVAPGSPDRILRDLRQHGEINYMVVSRSKSLYRALPLGV